MNKEYNDLLIENMKLKDKLEQQRKEYQETYKDVREEIKDYKKQLEEKDKVIDEIEKRCNQEISAATIQYERNKRNDTWQYIIAHKKILEILERDKEVK